MTRNDDTFRAAWCMRIVANKKNSYSSAPADKQINDYIFYSQPPLSQVNNKILISMHYFIQQLSDE